MTKTIVPHKKQSFFARLLSGFSDSGAAAEEKKRLEAFLSAYPGEYFGVSDDGVVLNSEGLCNLLKIDSIGELLDVQSRLSPDDAAALEGLFERLQKDGTSFSLGVKNHDDTKTLKISGVRGQAPATEHYFDVLWIEDMTGETEAHDSFVEQMEEKEQERQELDLMLDQVPRPLWLRDEKQDLAWVNATYADFLGKTKEDILENQKEIFGHLRRRANTAKDEIVPGKDMAAQALKKDEPIQSRVHNTIKGKRMLMNITEIPMPNMGRTLGIAYNVTREEELEAEMERYQSSNRELLEQLKSAVAIYGPDQTLEFYNAAFSQLWHLEEEWLNKKPTMNSMMEKLRETRRLPEQADFKGFKKTWLDMFTSLIDPFEDMMYLPDGTALRVLVVPASNGGLMLTFEDVSSRLELESSYNTLIAVQKETLDNLAEAVAVYGSDGRLKLCNPAYGRLWNLNPEDLEGEPHISRLAEKKKPFFELEEWPERQDELVSKGLDRLMHEGRLVRSDEVLIDYTTVPLPDGGVLITYADVTDSVRVENALREKFSALEAAEKLKLDFLANVSYQLRTPLNTIMGFNEILDQEYFGPLNQRQKQYTKDMKIASDRLLELINDILDLSTLEAGYMTLNRTDIKVKDMFEGIADLVSEWTRKEKIELEIKCPKNVGVLTADASRLKQALINLIRNAITHTPKDGKITLQAKRKKEGIELCVIDTGVGIKQEDRLKIFEPFQRAQSGSMEARLSKKGAGLGLSLVKNIIALHGGQVELDSEPGKGTTVTLFFPFTAVPTDLKLPIKETAA